MCKYHGENVPNAVRWGFELEVCEECCTKADKERRANSWHDDRAADEYWQENGIQRHTE